MAELSDLNHLLREQLLPHEHQDDAKVYPVMAQLIGGDDPLAAMSRMHREIHHLARLLSRMSKDLPPEGQTQTPSRKYRESFYHGLDAILRLHLLQENEIYHHA